MADTINRDSPSESQQSPELKELDKYLKAKNVAEFLSDDELTEIGARVKDWFIEDEDARSDWVKRSDEWIKLATQVTETKNHPWPKSANTKYPLLLKAAMQFAARAYPALVPGPKLVTGLVVGKDETGEKQQAAERVGTHLSYQVMYEMQDWEEDMDKLCFILPLVGCVFKKTYYDPIKQVNCSELVLPKDLVIDYYAKSIETATRKSHILYRTNNEIEERIRKKIWLDANLPLDPQINITSSDDAYNKVNLIKEPQLSPATPHKFIECHTFWDIDQDGYDEPYVITVHYDSGRVVRIVPRFTQDGIITEVDDNGKDVIVKIEPDEYFTKFSFIPNPSGSIYDLGFGLLLGSLNEVLNTLTNQLIDSGTLNNLQAGFLGRGIRMKAGQSKFSPGEWKPVDFTGDDIKKHIFPLPTKEPSEVLFKLLELLEKSGTEVASVAEIFVGKMPGQNTPATTTMASIDQALKVFTAIHKRMYRALQKEYQKLFKLNSTYIDSTVYFSLNDSQGVLPKEVYAADYDITKVGVKPNADPNIVSSAQRMMKMQAIEPLLQMGTIQPLEFTKRFLEAVEIENIPTLINTQPAPDPEMQKMQAEMQMKDKESQQKMQLAAFEAMLDAQMQKMEMKFKEMELRMKAQEHQMNLQASAQQTQQDLELGEMEHEQAMTQSSAEHEMNMQQTQEKGKLMQEQHQMKRQQMRQQAAAKKGKSSGTTK